MYGLWDLEKIRAISSMDMKHPPDRLWILWARKVFNIFLHEVIYRLLAGGGGSSEIWILVKRSKDQERVGEESIAQSTRIPVQVGNRNMYHIHR